MESNKFITSSLYRLYKKTFPLTDIWFSDEISAIEKNEILINLLKDKLELDDDGVKLLARLI